MFSQERTVAELSRRFEAAPAADGDEAVFELAGNLRLGVRRLPGVDWGVAWVALPLSAADDDEGEKMMHDLLRLALARLYRSHGIVASRHADRNAGGSSPILYTRLDADGAKNIDRIGRLLNEAEMVGKRLGGGAEGGAGQGRPRQPGQSESLASLFSGMQGMLRP